MAEQKTFPVRNLYGRLAAQHWKAVVELAERYGFIAQAYGGTALLLTHRVQLEQYGERGYLQIQKMNGHCARDLGYDGCLSDEGQLLSCETCAYRPSGAKWVRFEQNPSWSPE